MRWLVMLFLVSSLGITHAQEFPAKEYDLELLVENIFAVQDLDVDYGQLYENLAQILSNPINLNTATEEQLRSLFILNESQLNHFLNYQKNNGPFLSVYELQSIADIDEETFYRIMPFITVKEGTLDWKSLPKRILQEKNNYLLLRSNRTLETKRGYTNQSSETSRYAGSPERIYSRFRTSRSSDFSIGFTLEKDAGEALRWSPSQHYHGFDYASYHIQVLNKGRLSNLIIGDFQAQFGQGLLLGGGFGGGKGAESITTVRRSNLGFLPYTSLNESGFYRGVAASIRLKENISLHPFFSSMYRDGNQSDSLELSVSSLPSSGYHRTSTELSNRKSIRETNAGLVLTFQKNSMDIGAIIHTTHFSVPINRTPTAYNQFYFKGSQNINTGFYLNYSIGNATLFSEFAKTISHGSALVAGLLSSLTPHFDISILYRHHSRDFQSFYSNAFSESSTPQNESGLYLGWKYRFDKKHLVTGYFDLFKFPWLRFRGYAPLFGYEWLSRYTFQINRNTQLYLQAREESKIRNTQNESNTYNTENSIKRNFWINLDYKISPKLSFKSRIQFSDFLFERRTTRGFALIQDLNFTIKRFKLSSRYALFDTDDFDNRQYVYEKDVWLAYSFPFYNGIGVRNYILAQYSITKKIDVWLKWSRTQFENQEVIGSGSETIEGNSINDLKLQVRIKL